MSSDVLERARRFVEEGERQQAEKRRFSPSMSELTSMVKFWWMGTMCFWKCSETSKFSTIMWKSTQNSFAA